MLNRANWRWGASFLVLSWMVCPAVFAAEDAGLEKPSQTDSDSRSYLPPWMKDHPSGKTINASAPHTSPASASANAGTGSNSAAAVPKEPAKKEAAAPSEAAAKKESDSLKVLWPPMLGEGLVRRFTGLFQ